MLKGNNLIWKSRQTTDKKENFQCCNICLSTVGCYGNINIGIRVMVTLHTLLTCYHVKFKDPKQYDKLERLGDSGKYLKSGFCNFCISISHCSSAIKPSHSAHPKAMGIW